MEKHPNDNNYQSDQSELESLIDELRRLREENESIVNRIEGSVEEMQLIQEMLIVNKQKLRSVSVVEQEIERLSVQMGKAKEALQSMTAEQMNEIISYKNPPDRIKLVLEAVCFLLTSKRLNWDQIKREMVNSFVDRVLKINMDNIPPVILEDLKKYYFQHPDWEISKIYRASTAVGPLAEWIQGQAKILELQSQEDPRKAEVLVIKAEREKFMVEEERIVNEYHMLLMKQRRIREQIDAINARKEIIIQAIHEQDENDKKNNSSGSLSQTLKSTAYIKTEVKVDKKFSKSHKRPNKVQQTVYFNKRSELKKENSVEKFIQTDIDMNNIHKLEKSSKKIDKTVPEKLRKGFKEKTEEKQNRAKYEEEPIHEIKDINSVKTTKREISKDEKRTVSQKKRFQYDYKIMTQSKSPARNADKNNIDIHQEIKLLSDREDIKNNPFANQNHKMTFGQQIMPDHYYINKQSQPSHRHNQHYSDIIDDSLEILYNGQRITPEEYDMLMAMPESNYDIMTSFAKPYIPDPDYSDLSYRDNKLANSIRETPQIPFTNGIHQLKNQTMNTEGKVIWNFVDNISSKYFDSNYDEGKLDIKPPTSKSPMLVQGQLNEPFIASKSSSNLMRTEPNIYGHITTYSNLNHKTQPMMHQLSTNSLFNYSPLNSLQDTNKHKSKSPSVLSIDIRKKKTPEVSKQNYNVFGMPDLLLTKIENNGNVYRYRNELDK